VEEAHDGGGGGGGGGGVPLHRNAYSQISPCVTDEKVPITQTYIIT